MISDADSFGSKITSPFKLLYDLGSITDSIFTIHTVFSPGRTLKDYNQNLPLLRVSGKALA